MVKYGYARVSSAIQKNNYSLEIQKEKLISKGVLKENIITEVGSASDFNRPELNKLLETTKTGDIITVTKVDRFARCTISAMQAITKLNEKNVKLFSLDLWELSSLGPKELPTLLIRDLHAMQQN